MEQQKQKQEQKQQEEQQPKILKTFHHITCPHCSKAIHIGIQSSMSGITSVSTPGKMMDIKESIIDRLDDIVFFEGKDKREIIAYLKDENTIIDSADVEPMLKQIAIEQLSRQQNESTNLPNPPSQA